MFLPLDLLNTKPAANPVPPKARASNPALAEAHDAVVDTGDAEVLCPRLKTALASRAAANLIRVVKSLIAREAISTSSGE